MRRLVSRPFRLFLLFLLAIGLAPGTWLRTSIPPPDFTAPLTIVPLGEARGLESLATGEVSLKGAWKLTSENAHFGGYSAMITLPDNRLLVGSDRGRLLEMPLPQDFAKSDVSNAITMSFFAGTKGGPRIFVDLESLERDEQAKRIWGAYEYKGRIERFERGGSNSSARGILIDAMKDWPDNGGAETMVRLDDGRFVILAETSSYKSRIGLIFAGDPLENREPEKFRFMPPEGYSPVDGTLLPDGRVMILVRKVVWGAPPRFGTALVVADPAEIEPGAMWRGEVIAKVEGPDLDENFEGIAALERDGGVDLYLVADDNISAFQETLMLRLHWKPKPAAKSQVDSKKARGEFPAAP